MTMFIVYTNVGGLVNWLVVKEHDYLFSDVFSFGYDFTSNSIPVVLKEVNQEFHTLVSTVSAVWLT